MNPPCARCNKTVYPIEKLSCLDKVWHKACFHCEVCKMALNMKNYKGYDKRPYCNMHYPKQSFTSVADTPENLRLKQQSELQSQVKYKEEFEKAKGRACSQVSDTPEMMRIRKAQDQISDAKYHEEFEKNKGKGYAPVTDNVTMEQQRRSMHEVGSDAAAAYSRGSTRYSADEGGIAHLGWSPAWAGLRILRRLLAAATRLPDTQSHEAVPCRVRLRGGGRRRGVVPGRRRHREREADRRGLDVWHSAEDRPDGHAARQLPPAAVRGRARFCRRRAPCFDPPTPSSTENRLTPLTAILAPRHHTASRHRRCTPRHYTSNVATTAAHITPSFHHQHLNNHHRPPHRYHCVANNTTVIAPLSAQHEHVDRVSPKAAL
ncbi:uncharacterized protein LOC144933909 isoform X1 [Lampetra fluviatilis]